MVFLINCRNHLSQEHLNGFLSDLNITDCKLGSKLADLKANEKIKNDLSFIFVSDSLNLYQLKFLLGFSPLLNVRLVRDYLIMRYLYLSI